MNWTREQLERWNVLDLRKYAVKDLGMTYSVVNYLSKEGLIAAICEREELKPPESDPVGGGSIPSGEQEDDFYDIFSDRNTPENAKPEPCQAGTDNGNGEGQGNNGENAEGAGDKGDETLPPPPPPPQEDPLAKIIAMAVKKYLETDGIDPEIVMMAIEQKTDELKAIIANGMNELDNEIQWKITRAINKAAKQVQARPVVVSYTAPDKPDKDIGIQHFMFEDIVKTVLALPPQDRNIFLVGPAGSGKNTIVEKIAEIFERSFFTIPVGLNTSKADLLGYMSASGTYVTTPLRQAFECGGVCLIDEIDSGNPNVLTCLGALTANSYAGFPDGLVKRHDDFILFAAGNTFGLGADMQYVGRLQLDGATRDRFVFKQVPYDEQLEKVLAPNKEWYDRVIAFRNAVSHLGERVIVSPRATIKGGYLANAGIPFDVIADEVIFRGVNADVRSRIIAQVETANVQEYISSDETEAA